MTAALPAVNNWRDEEAETMTSAIFESVSAPRPDRLQSASPATAADAGVSPDVTGFYDEATGSIQYVVADPVTRKSAIIDTVLDFDPRSGSTQTTSADRLLKPSKHRGSPWNGSSTPIRMRITFLPPVI
jgi:hypothetical protein